MGDIVAKWAVRRYPAGHSGGADQIAVGDRLHVVIILNLVWCILDWQPLQASPRGRSGD